MKKAFLETFFKQYFVNFEGISKNESKFDFIKDEIGQNFFNHSTTIITTSKVDMNKFWRYKW